MKSACCNESLEWHKERGAYDRGADEDQEGEGHYIAALEVQGGPCAAFPAGATAVAACLHSDGERLGTFEAADKEWNQQGSELFHALQQIARIEAHTACSVGFCQAFNLPDKDWHELQGDDQDHDEGIDRDAQFLQGREQYLQAIGQVHHRGSKHKHRDEIVQK